MHVSDPLAYCLTSVPLMSLGIYSSSVICTVRPKSTNTALSDIKTMLLAKDKRENKVLGFADVKELQCIQAAVLMLRVQCLWHAVQAGV